MQVEVKRLYIRDWHGRFAHVPGSEHALGTVVSGEDIAPLVAAKGWARVDPRLIEKQVRDDLAQEIDPDKAHQIAQRLVFAGRLPRAYTNGSVTIRISPDVSPDLDQKMLLDVAFMDHTAHLTDIDIRVDDDYVTNGSGEVLDHASTGVMGWTATTPGAGDTTIAIRPNAWSPWHQAKQKPGMLMAQAQHNLGRYLVAHEWGHASLQPKDMGPEFEDRLQHLWGEYPYRGSKYGATTPAEFYAEHFAEWHVSGGTTKNDVTQQMAVDFGWFMAKDMKAQNEASRKKWGLPYDRWDAGSDAALARQFRVAGASA
jgi:hypothetical protein